MIHTKSSPHGSPQRTSCRLVEGLRPMAVQTRLVMSASTPAPQSTSLKCGSGWPG